MRAARSISDEAGYSRPRFELQNASCWNPRPWNRYCSKRAARPPATAGSQPKGDPYTRCPQARMDRGDARATSSNWSALSETLSHFPALARGLLSDTADRPGQFADQRGLSTWLDLQKPFYFKSTCLNTTKSSLKAAALDSHGNNKQPTGAIPVQESAEKEGKGRKANNGSVYASLRRPRPITSHSPNTA